MISVRMRCRGLIATAEDLARDHPDQSILLGLAARRTGPIPKADIFLRFASSNYPFRKVLRGHEGKVFTAQFSPRPCDRADRIKRRNYSHLGYRQRNSIA